MANPDTTDQVYVEYGGITGRHNQMGKNSLGEIVRWFKGRVKYEICKKLNTNFSWQSNYYDRIIRNEYVLNRIREYIINNPIKWHLDKINFK